MIASDKAAHIWPNWQTLNGYAHLYSLVARTLLHAQKVGMARDLIHYIIGNVLSSPAHAQLCHDSACENVSRTIA